MSVRDIRQRAIDFDTSTGPSSPLMDQYVNDVMALLEVMESHFPEVGVEISDSTWLMCSCGWDSSETKTSWPDHLFLS